MKKRVLVLNCGTLASTDINMSLRYNEEFEIWEYQKIKECNFKFILAPHEDLVLYLQKNKDKIDDCIVCSNYETALLCRYKSKIYEKMKKYDFIPKIYKK